MERLEGSSVKDVLSHEGLPIARVLDIGVQIADALEAAHAKGIVHRDIKPSNLWLTTRGDVKVLDFGLAKRARARELAASDGDTATEDRDVTNAGAAVGTLGYMSPEQARGEEVDGRSDLFSLGAVLYEMATGKAAFPGKTTAVVLDAVLNREPVEAGGLEDNATRRVRSDRRQGVGEGPSAPLPDRLGPEGGSPASEAKPGAEEHEPWPRTASGREPRRAVARRRIARRVVGGVRGRRPCRERLAASVLRPCPASPTSGRCASTLVGFRTRTRVSSSTWATDGVRLYFVKWKQDEYGLFQVPVAGGEASEIEIPSRSATRARGLWLSARQSALLCLTAP